MKKKLLCLFILLMMITGCLPKKETPIENPEITEKPVKTEPPVEQKLSYYKDELENRYQEYQKKNPNLTEEEIITYVNIGLDQPYYTNTKETPHLNKNYILTNKYLYMPDTYIPENLENINLKYASGTKQLVHEAKLAFEEMSENAKTEGYTIRAMSAYRSYQYQLGLYNRYVNQDGKEKADTYSARPGYSEHQTGLVVDVDNNRESYTNFENTKEFTWMQDNAHKYGFILRYPKGKENITGYTYESWHYRYVGKEIAGKIYNTKLTLDEYYVRFIDK